MKLATQPLHAQGSNYDFGPEMVVESVGAGVTRSWMLDRHIVVFRTPAASRAVVDAWIDSVKQTMIEWPKDQVYLALHDMSSKAMALTPYARDRALELIPLSTGLSGYAALIVPPTFVSHVIRMYLRAQRSQGNENQLFFSINAGLAWLVEQGKITDLATPDKEVSATYR